MDIYPHAAVYPEISCIITDPGLWCVYIVYVFIHVQKLWNYNIFSMSKELRYKNIQLHL